MGNTCKPMAVSFQCMTKFTTNKKKNNEIPGKIIPFVKKNIIRVTTTEKFSQHGDKYDTRLKLVRVKSCVKEVRQMVMKTVFTDTENDSDTR